MATDVNKEKMLKQLLEGMNNVLGTHFELSYHPAMRGYMLQTKFRGDIEKYPYIIKDMRLKPVEMAAYLNGIYNGVKAARDQIFKQRVIYDDF